MIPATPKKLETGEWGVQVTGPVVRAGDTVLVTTRAGKTFTKTIKDVISSSGGVVIQCIAT